MVSTYVVLGRAACLFVSLSEVQPTRALSASGAFRTHGPMDQSLFPSMASDDQARDLALAYARAHLQELILGGPGVSNADDVVHRFRGFLAASSLTNQALGVLMQLREVSAEEALELLLNASWTSNRTVSVVAAEIIESMTGHAPEPFAGWPNGR